MTIVLIGLTAMAPLLVRAIPSVKGGLDSLVLLSRPRVSAAGDARFGISGEVAEPDGTTCLSRISVSACQWISRGGFVELSEEEIVEEAIEGMLEEERATIAVVEDVAPAVVSIVIEKERGEVLAFDDYGYDFYAPFLAEELYTEEELTELVEIGGGTGFFVTSDGYIVTNKHVISDEGATFTVLTNDGQTLEAVVVATHPFEDLAVLDVEGEGYPTAKLGDSENMFIGQTVIAIGYSLSEFQNTVTKGVISGLDRSLLAGDYLNEVFIDNAILNLLIQQEMFFNKRRFW